MSGDGWDATPSAVFYTVMPMHLALRGWDAEAGRGLRQATGPGGVPLLVRDGPSGPVIERVLSTRPSDFLRADLAPGRPLPGGGPPAP